MSADSVFAEYSVEMARLAGNYLTTVTKANIQVVSGSVVATQKLAAGILEQLAPPAKTFGVEAELYPTPASLRVDQFVGRTDTPGNVGICLSGGGSRSLIASMGQLRGLKALGLLGKVKAISTVSGGSWAAVPFMYLPDEIPEDNFLNGFVADPGEFTLSGASQPNKAAALDYLPPGNLGGVCASPGMSITGLAIQAYKLLTFDCLRPEQLWVRLIGDNVLAPFGLSAFNDQNEPESFFAHSRAMAEAILSRNPALPPTAFVYRTPQCATDVLRPFHICNTSMFIQPNPGSSYNPDSIALLAPVQSTAFFTGILGTGLGTDAGGLQVGGGGVASFGFGGTLDSVASSPAIESMKAPFALADITGMSSAFYASLLKETIPALDIINPLCNYWPVANMVAPAGALNQFADGGDLEDNGVCGMLAYEDIDRLIVFVNSTPMSKDRFGNVQIDEWLPTLFGFAPYRKGPSSDTRGYFLYSDMIRGVGPSIRSADLYFQHNQVFPSEQFHVMLDAVWQNSGAGSNENPAVFLQTGLDVLPNSWFHIRGGRKVDVLWVILNPVESWVRQLKPEVQGVITREFPNYNIMQIHQSAENVNLMSSLTAWTIYQQAATLNRMFTQAPL
jgi:hypothetical protein